MITKPIQYIKEAQVEIKKVTWPTRQQSLQYTTIVVVISVVATIILGGLDMLFNYILTTFIL
ncbi:MAG: preprotein translocase subunit SecE [Minisyncoccia bacterium]